MKTKTRNYFLRLLVLILISILLNIAATMVAGLFPVKFRINTVGTMVSTLSGGFIPGVISTFSSNLIFKAMSREGIYYTAFNFVTVILTAIIRHTFIKHRKNEKILYPYVFLCVIFIAAFKTLLLYILGYTDNEGRSVLFVDFIYNNFNITKGNAMLLGNFIYEDLDISISAFCAYYLIKLVPIRIRGEFYNTDIWQGRLPEEMQRNINELKVKRSFKRKLFIIVNVIMFTSIITSFVVSFTVFKEHITKEDLKISNIAIERIIDKYNVNQFEDYSDGTVRYGYLKMIENIKEYTNYDDTIICTYIFKDEGDYVNVIVEINNETDNYIGPGHTFAKLHNKMYSAALNSVDSEKNVIMNSDTYGEILLNTVNVLDKDGTPTDYYVGCALPMNRIESIYKDFAARFLSVIVILIISETIGIYWFINNNMVRPIKAISYIVANFKYGNDEDRKENFRNLRKLEITTDDEIENLYNALLITIKEENRQSTILRKKNEKIDEMQKNLISALAELVESRDNDTGEHIKKTAEYVNIIARKMQERDYYKTQVTDSFIENITYAAPLHDIGKIQVSDNILLKPGKLTDEEFEKMKEHTVYGGKILKNICDYIPDIEYLREAQFMAEYHHEKWNGKGYPYNLSGESIPLSARIMAVADVFDALVSKRVYKDAFSFEKAVSIIQEESGQQFDPLVVDAFTKSLDEVRHVKEQYD